MNKTKASWVGNKSESQNTFDYLGKLPRVPLPSLQDSVNRFKLWCAPLLNNEEKEQTYKAADDFLMRAGPVYHDLLKKYDQQSGIYSWLDGFWSTRYLGRRTPVSVNANFVFLFVDTHFSQVQRAARLIAGGVYFKQQLDQELIPPAMMRDTPLCMTQHKYLFATTRRPHKKTDTVSSPYSEQHPGPSTDRHILVIYQHILYTLDVIDEHGASYSLPQLETALNNIIAAPLPATESVGYLTTLPRDDWADARSELILDDINQQAIEKIEDALFCVCLDDTAPSSLQSGTDGLLHGDGGNRWFDKSISLVVFQNGVAGVNCEHCALDGTTVINFVEFLHSNSTAKYIESIPDASEEAVWQNISFNLTAPLRQTLNTAKLGFDKLVENTATQYDEFTEFGADLIKKLRVSPDAFVQIAFQLAHFRTKGLVGTTYESIAMRHYDRGRTEAMRVVTPEMLIFVEAMASLSITNNEKTTALHNAANAHVNRVRECQRGEAPEQHLWQLQMLAESDSELDLFQSPGWLKMRNDYLSTSSAPSADISVFGFGATSTQCIGVAYLVRKDKVVFYLSTPTTVAHYLPKFAEHLHSALQDMATLLQEKNND